MDSGYVSVNNLKLHYVQEGEGPLVILLHGFPDFWYGWRKQIPVLSRNYRVVAPDMRGYNLSDKPEGVENYRLRILASDIAELIKGWGAEPAFVVGHDWGGAVAWALATYYPELVAKLAVLNSPHPSEMRKALYTFNLAQWRRSYYIFLFQLPFIPEWIIGRNLEKFFRAAFKKTSENDIGEYVKAYSSPGTLTATINYYRAAMRSLKDFKFDEAHGLTMPVLMLWGEQDKWLGKELINNSRDHCDNLEIVCDPTSGHWVQLDNPELVNRKLLEFFGK